MNRQNTMSFSSSLSDFYRQALILSKMGIYDCFSIQSTIVCYENYAELYESYVKI